MIYTTSGNNISSVWIHQLVDTVTSPLMLEYFYSLPYVFTHYWKSIRHVKQAWSRDIEIWIPISAK